MKNVSIKNDERDSRRNIRLHNGTLVVQYNGEDKATNVYIVTSFRNSKNIKHWGYTAKYCSLVSLDTGYLAFEEPSSRHTTEFRLLRHLCKCCYNAGQSDYYYDDTKINDSYIKVFDAGDYLLEIDLKRESVKGR